MTIIQHDDRHWLYWRLLVILSLYPIRSTLVKFCDILLHTVRVRVRYRVSSSLRYIKTAASTVLNFSGSTIWCFRVMVAFWFKAFSNWLRYSRFNSKMDEGRTRFRAPNNHVYMMYGTMLRHITQFGLRLFHIRWLIAVIVQIFKFKFSTVSLVTRPYTMMNYVLYCYFKLIVEEFMCIGRIFVEMMLI